MTNISSLEIAELRPFFTTAIKQLETMQRPAQLEAHTEALAPTDTTEPDAELSVRVASSAEPSTQR